MTSTRLLPHSTIYGQNRLAYMGMSDMPIYQGRVTATPACAMQVVMLEQKVASLESVVDDMTRLHFH